MGTQFRDNAIDIAKGIGILLVIIGHTGGLPAHSTVHHFIYSFHMPLFFILGGYFFKPSSVNMHIRKDAKRLLLPYVFSVFLLLLWFVILGIKYDNYGMVWRTIQTASFGSGQYHTSPIWGDYPTIGMIWFLLAMFWCRVVYNVIANLPTLYKYLTGAVIAIAATLIDNFVINLPGGILPGLSAIMFYMIGNALRENLSWINERHTAFFIVGIICWILALLFSGMGMARCYYENYILDIAGACGATWCIYWLSTRIDHNTRYTRNILSWFGVNSMVVLCAHFLEESSFLWEHLHVPAEWYVILPSRLLIVIIFTFISYKLSFTKYVFNLKNHNG